MEFFIGFLVALGSLYSIKKYWAAFFVGVTIFVIIHFIVLSSKASEGSNMNIDGFSISNTIGQAIGIFIIPFFAAAVIYGFTKKTEKKKAETTEKKD